MHGIDEPWPWFWIAATECSAGESAVNPTRYTGTLMCVTFSSSPKIARHEGGTSTLIPVATHHHHHNHCQSLLSCVFELERGRKRDTVLKYSKLAHQNLKKRVDRGWLLWTRHQTKQQEMFDTYAWRKVANRCHDRPRRIVGCKRAESIGRAQQPDERPTVAATQQRFPYSSIVDIGDRSWCLWEEYHTTRYTRSRIYVRISRFKSE